eukprot:4882588-Pleurochrysis_carterae.AAC.8
MRHHGTNLKRNTCVLRPCSVSAPQNLLQRKTWLEQSGQASGEGMVIADKYGHALRLERVEYLESTSRLVLPSIEH